MNHCSRHFDDIKQALKQKGLWHLVDLDPEVIKYRGHQWLHGKTTDRTFDPFVATSLEINSKLIMLVGPNWQTTHGKCGLCVVERFLDRGDAPKSWIDNITDLMVVVAITNGIERKNSV